jgi:hypothetical protein
MSKKEDHESYALCGPQTTMKCNVSNHYMCKYQTGQSQHVQKPEFVHNAHCDHCYILSLYAQLNRQLRDIYEVLLSLQN